MDFDNPINCLTTNVHRFARALIRQMENALRPLGLTSHQFTTLTVIKETGPISTNDLAKIIDVERTTMTRNIIQMHKKNWIEPVFQKDQKTKLFQLTGVGLDLQSSALPVWNKVQQKMTDDIGRNISAEIISIAKQQ